MNGLLYTLTLEEPVLANSLGGEPNSARSLFYIPGGLVRGAAINAYSGEKDAEDDTFRCLFLDGRTRYLNAYPLDATGRAYPIPLKYRKPKYFQSSDLGRMSGDHIQAIKDIWQVNVHTQRDAERGRATAEAGAVYRYIALPAGMRFQGAILAKDDIATIKDLLNGKTILLGKARTAGYGRAKLEVTDLPGDWREAGKPLEADSGEFTLTLLSPTLVRDANGQFSLGIETALEAHLGEKPNIIGCYCKPTIAGGFNRTWGLPLPQVIAIAAGSVFIIQDAPVEKLKRLEETGIGERRAEGYGRVAINLPLPDELPWDMADPQMTGMPTPAQPLLLNETAKLMLKRRLRHELDVRVIHAAREAISAYEKGKIPNSQLSRWRVILRDALGKREKEDPIARMKTFGTENKGKPGWQKMEKARIKVKTKEGDEVKVITFRLTEWIESMLEKPEVLYPALELEPDHGLALGSNSIEVKSWNGEYRLRLLDAVLAMMEKKNSEGGENG